jgi:hypothetical protein
MIEVTTNKCVPFLPGVQPQSTHHTYTIYKSACSIVACYQWHFTVNNFD